MNIVRTLENGKDGIITLPDGQKIDTTWDFEQVKTNLNVFDTDYRLFSGRQFAGIHHKGGMVWIWFSGNLTKITGVSYFPEDGFGGEYKLWKRRFWD